MNTVDTAITAARVDRGIAWLSEHGYTLSELDIETFDVSDGSNDPLGQTMGSQWIARRVAAETGVDMTEEWLVGHGIYAEVDNDDEDNPVGWTVLQTEWLHRIAAHQGVGVPDVIWPEDRDTDDEDEDEDEDAGPCTCDMCAPDVDSAPYAPADACADL
jgi:hypothetical protein